MEINENELILNNINLAYKVAHIYYNKLNGFIELEELQSLCFLGLTKAANMFDKNKNFAFSTYAYKVMKNEIIQNFNKIKDINSNTHVSLSHQLGETLYIEDTLSSIENIEDIIEKNMMIDKLYEFIDTLTEIEQKIVKEHLKGKTYKQLEEIVNLDQKTIYDIYKKALNKLRFKFYRYVGGEYNE